MTGVAITGLGLVTPAGIGWEATWRGLCTGVSTAAPDPVLDGLPIDFSCHVRDFEPRAMAGKSAWRLDRFTQLAVTAARLAVEDARVDTAAWDADRVAVVMGVGSTSLETLEKEHGKVVRSGRSASVSPLTLPRAVPNMAAGEIALQLGVHGPNLTLSTDSASGASALGTALDLLRAGRCDMVLAGGAESPRSSRFTALLFSQMATLSARCDTPATASRPFDADRDGFVLGEGAAVLVLERTEHALARRTARVRARLLGFGASADAYHPTGADPTGAGVSLAVAAALRDAGLGAPDIDHVNAHGTGTVPGDLVESRVLGRLFPHRPPVTANKGALGHALGAAGAIEAACAVLSLEHQTVPPTANLDSPDPQVTLDVVAKTPRRVRMDHALSTSYGFGGQNAVLVLGR
ncbi:beta-ketoacyl-[acyl-carrier-protein] synthase family protein [Streptomyces cavernae]|uniref:beta-ketoacyl-[acyl-carrier-protein] synthase family protein n=1 Tax=Streptomyces cavernae TaxID=2259034 RepID=UPI000FEBF886|nr:beta-ketoacyl-[acyl-carrier-protein] synthase family protein [Streptomyces cavernae]